MKKKKTGNSSLRFWRYLWMSEDARRSWIQICCEKDYKSKQTQQKCIHFFPQFIHIFFSSQKSHWIQAIMSFSIQPIMLKSLWCHERCFRCTLMTFFHILFRRCQQKIEIFQSLGIFFGHWLKHEPFERKLCDDNHNGINHKILKWQLNRIKSKNSQSTNFSWNCECKRIDLWPKYACGATILVGI